MAKIIGRRVEQRRLQKVFDSEEAEFIAIYGRRRIGKTYLIRNLFQNKSCVFFQTVGIHKAAMKVQLKKFRQEIETTFYQNRKGIRLQDPKSWIDALEMLNDAIEMFGIDKKVVLFFDEIPWLATHKSGLLEALDYYWNRFWANNKNIKLIICGSAASWIIDKVLNNRGGLHNRVTCSIRLDPFTIVEVQDYLSYRNIKLNHVQIIQLYMCLGGIPFYLKFIESGLSAIQNINQICFQKNSPLAKEFDNLFSALFDNSEMHESIIKCIASKRYGVSRKEIENKFHYKGGRLTRRLAELEEAGFVQSFIPWHKKRGTYFKIIDEYVLFYLTWVLPDAQSRIEKEIDLRYWEEISQSMAWKSWAGYAFEALCFKHLSPIKEKLKIPSGAMISNWEYIPTKKSQGRGAQIDLLFDRNDGVITICEIKYTAKSFIIDKKYADELKQKIAVYKEVTKTEKQIFIAMISANGLKKNKYSQTLISGEVSLEDFFR